MRIPLILLTLGLLSFNACAVEPPSTEPFAKRYDPHSITTPSGWMSLIFNTIKT